MTQKKHERSLVKVLAGWSPRVATGLTAWLFFRTRRSPRPARERALLKRAAATAKLEGVRVWRFGPAARPTVLLVHGWNGRGAQLGPLVEPLTAAGLSVVLFDGRGHGDGAGRSASLPGLADDVARVARWAGDVVGLVAHSMGGPSSALALRELPAVGRVAFISPPADPRQWVGAVSDFVGLPPELRPDVSRRVEQVARRPLAELVAEQLGDGQSAELLVVHDLDDREVPWEAGRRWADAWPSATLHSTRQLGHRRILRSPAVVDVVARFVTGRGDAPFTSADETLRLGAAS